MKFLAALGDAAILITFAGVGRSSHHAQDNGAVLGTLGTAAPFLIGWFLAALAGGAYRDSAFAGQHASAVTVARGWVPGCLIGCGIRSATEGHLTPPSFVAIALGFNLVLLVAWRALLGAMVGRSPRD